MSTSPELSRRLGLALGAHQVTWQERKIITDAMDQARTWGDLPAAVRQLVEQIEARPVALAG